jgi:glutamate synthase (NADPH/NADH) large chain
MSGGIAYVFDPENALERLCNREMVDLETLEDEDKAEVKAMIEKHHKYTGSDPAEWVLENWETASDLFVKVMPRDYKAVIQKQKAQSRQAVNGKVTPAAPALLKK